MAMWSLDGLSEPADDEPGLRRVEAAGETAAMVSCVVYRRIRCRLNGRMPQAT